MKRRQAAAAVALALGLAGAGLAGAALATAHGQGGMMAGMSQCGMMGGGAAQGTGEGTAPPGQGGMMQGMAGCPMMRGAQAQAAEGHAAHGASGPDDVSGSPATQAYRAANLAMHAAMDIEFTDDADLDFARGMIGHHRGAIDMARIVLEHGEDPELRQLAEEVIAAQEAEIEFLGSWLERRGD